ncbi:MAG: hypothetical protein HWQ38_01050 [Nostoc sp. NMS7]|uniref:hypothetical protein n=1 Tax=Nostoc sp. NMS7 TaxID=2815391 RepID=UPI0025EAFAE9|nr:hypothetical protein [Nostoc sp. NMS7]MBN3945140.1 hypothetical protein [Nostoc sp. NMS7]
MAETPIFTFVFKTLWFTDNMSLVMVNLDLLLNAINAVVRDPVLVIVWQFVKKSKTWGDTIRPVYYRNVLKIRCRESLDCLKTPS